MDFDKLIRKAKRRPIADLSGASVTSVDYGRDAIMKILPNRPPFLFIDQIVGIDLENQFIVGQCNIDEKDPVFTGHFPDNPVYPGVLQLEMLSELFCCLYYFISQSSTTVSDAGPVALRATRMRDAFLQRGVFPGERITVVTKVLELTPLTFTGIGQVLCKDQIAIAVIGDFYIAGD